MTVLKAGRWQQLPWETQHHPCWAPGHQDCGAVKDPAQHTCSFLVTHHSPRPVFWTSKLVHVAGTMVKLEYTTLAGPPPGRNSKGGRGSTLDSCPAPSWVSPTGGYRGQSHRSIRLHRDSSIGTASRQVSAKQWDKVAMQKGSMAQVHECLPLHPILNTHGSISGMSQSQWKIKIKKLCNPVCKAFEKHKILYKMDYRDVSWNSRSAFQPPSSPTLPKKGKEAGDPRHSSPHTMCLQWALFPSSSLSGPSMQTANEAILP